MTSILQLNHVEEFSGLGTFYFPITTAGIYAVSVRTTIPLSSALVINIKHNNHSVISTGGTADNPTPTQQTLNCETSFQCSAADEIEIWLTSANAVDKLPNSVKGTVSLNLIQVG